MESKPSGGDDEVQKRGRVFVIRGCEGRGDKDSAYLTRVYLARTPWGTLALHIFHRSDADVHHDHPWPFWTLVLWRGYVEHYRDAETRVSGQTHEPLVVNHSRRIRPLQFLFRPATFTHWVELHKSPDGREKPAVTLVWMGKKERSWGFHEASGWTYWRDYFKKKGC